MKISNAARLIFWLAAIFAIGILVRAESSEKRANTPNTKSAPLRIVDQNGRPAVNGVPSPNGQTVDVAVGPDFAFHPDTVNISVGDTVRWTWDGSGHSVTSGPPCAADSQFCSPNDTSCFPGVLSNARYSVYAYLRERWQLFISLPRPLRCWHDRRGQCCRWLRTIRLVGGSAPANSGCPNGWRLFSAQRKILRHGRSRFRHSWQRVHSSV